MKNFAKINFNFKLNISKKEIENYENIKSRIQSSDNHFNIILLKRRLQYKISQFVRNHKNLKIKKRVNILILFKFYL